jgi:epoxyqueuosine reductase
LISPRFGTFFNIGCLLTDLELTPAAVSFEKEPFGAVCGECRACIDACPAGVLSDFNRNKKNCISCLTQTKEPLTEKQMRVMGNRLYGCDVCQTCCRYNAHIESIEAVQPKIAEILKLTNREFKEQYEKTAIGWRGLSVLKRNAVIAAANSGARDMLPAETAAALKKHPVIGCAAQYYSNEIRK